jgi:hypothetical protein
MRKIIITGTAIAATFALAATAQANTVIDDFDSFNVGHIGGQGGWTAGAKYDANVVDMGAGRSLRISNAVVDGSFADMPFSAPVARAGESETNKVLFNEFKFRSATSDVQPGLAMSVSPTDGDGNRMSYVRLQDTPDGINVTFMDTPTGYVDPARHVAFETQTIATGLDRTVDHTIRFETKFVPGQDNDIVRVFVDGQSKACGTSWENYYRYDAEQVGGGNTVKPSDRLMWRLGGTAAPATKGNGFLFDDVTSASQATGGPAPCTTPPADGEDGAAGDKGESGATGASGAAGATGTAGQNGTNGVNGQDGASGIAAAGVTGRSGANAGTDATLRTLHAPTVKGMKFVSARASLRGKRLPVSGRKITVDLRGRAVGNYNVSVVAKYKTKGGKLHVVRITRNLSVHAA